MKTSELLRTAEKHVLFTSVRPNIVMASGKGMYIKDTDGKEYLDFIGGWAVTSLGHSPDILKQILAAQSELLISSSPSFYNVPMLLFTELLVKHSCFDRVFFTSTGAEANEGAIKLARKYGSKYLNGAYEFITFQNAFHGRTLATMSATGKRAWNELYEPKVSGFKQVPLNDISALNAAVSDKTCAIIMEPIQGEGGVWAADEAFLRGIRKICDETGALLIFDEIQTGMGRTGTLFAYQHDGIEPDILTLGKGIAGGYPLSAMLVKEKCNVFDAGDHGGTYTAQPLGMAVGYAVVNEIITRDLPQNAKVQGDYLKGRLEELQQMYGLRNIRGRGLLIAFDLPRNNGKEVVERCMEEGLLINSPHSGTIRLMPALIVNRGDIDAMIGILSKVLEAFILSKPAVEDTNDL